jgi:acyl dehydratase
MQTTVILEKEFVITEPMVSAFADMIDDHNPIHLDKQFAATTRFERPIAQGVLVGSLISGRLVEAFGDGTIYVEQHYRFRRPVHVGSRVRVVFSEPKNLEKGRVEVKTEVLLDDGEAAVTGTAVVIPGKKKGF